MAKEWGIMEGKNAGRRFDLETLKRWRLIQISALLPLTVLGSLMIYFDQVSPFGILAFFLILIVGVMIPQIRGEMILSHFVLTKELEARVVDCQLVEGQNFTEGWESLRRLLPPAKRRGA